MSFSTGMFSKIGDGQADINPDRAAEVGLSVQSKLDGLSYTDTIQTKYKVKTLACLRKPAKSKAGKVVTVPVVDSLVLFNRLVMITERNGSLEEALQYELTIQPLSLFDTSQLMRKAPKAALGQYLKTFTPIIDKVDPMPLTIDGGWLLHQITFNSGETFGSILTKYCGVVQALKKGQPASVVFDGYSRSPKDHDRTRRSKLYSSNISIREDTPCTITKSRFMANGHNKTELIKLLSERLKSMGVKVIVARDDADTLIVREALRLAAGCKCEVRAEDTDLLCMLIHHSNLTSNDVVFSTGKGSFSIKGIVGNLADKEKTLLLFAHAFTGCDTTSTIYGLGKKRVLKKLAATGAPSESIDVMTSLRSHPDKIMEAGICIFQYLYGNKSHSLHKMRHERYCKAMAKGKMQPQSLPPTAGAAAQHSLRVYLQWHDWALMKSMSLAPFSYGWSQSLEDMNL